MNRLLRKEIRSSPLVRRLIEGHGKLQPQPYAKWQGGPWVLIALAHLGYPTNGSRGARRTYCSIVAFSVDVAGTPAA